MGNVPAAARFVIKRHARRPYLRMFVKDQNGDAYDLTGAVGATFVLADSAGAVVFSSTAVLESPLTSGYMRYEWAAGDTGTAGEFRGEFEVSYGASGNLTLPVKGNILVKIYEDLDNI